MQRVDGRLLLSPADLNHFLDCEYLTQLDLDAIDGRVHERHRTAEADLLASKGEAHERSQLERFGSEGRSIAVIPDPGRDGDWRRAAASTVHAMQQGAQVIYQGVLLADGWRGRADFLVRVPMPSALGAWSYEAWDTKLARHAKPSHLLQLAYYSEQMAAIQRVDPAWMRLVLGSAETVAFRYRDVCAYFRSVRRRFASTLAGGLAADPYPVAHCTVCDYAAHCGDRWIREDHLSLIAGIRRSHVDQLRRIGIATSAALARSRPQIRDCGISDPVLQRLQQQAALQAGFRATGVHRFELLPATDENGFRLLPLPSDGDVFFDMEGYPFFEASGGLEYLFGAVTVDGHCHAFRATNRDEEKRAFEQFVDFVWDRLRRWPDLHIYHYAHYEPTALKRLMSTHSTREQEIDELLRREVFVDLYQVVRRTMRTSHDSYSLKAIRQFFMPEAGQGEVTDGAQSVIEFQRWLDTGDTRILDAIARYNEEDCISTRRLRDWLLERKRDCERQFGVDVPFCAPPRRATEAVQTQVDEHAERRARLLAHGDPASTLLSHLLDYHRREAKPEWWAYFERRKKTLDELLDDTEAIAYVAPTDRAPEPTEQSLIYTLAFRPQEFKLKVDAAVEGPFGQGGAGTIEWIDAAAGLVGLRRGNRRHAEPIPTALLAPGPVDDKAQRSALVRVAEAACHGWREYRALADLLHRKPPRYVTRRDRLVQALDIDEQKRLVAALDESYLVVQGPPGTGKTWAGARLIVSLLACGKRIGITAPSHRAIHNLLEEVERVATSEGVPFAGLKKRSTSNETAFTGRFVTSVNSNEECERSAAQLIAGTAWLFAREAMNASFDYLFVDEAGQVALADALAVGTSARNLVLLGDPQQLPHVTHNTHPCGAGVSVLQHVLGEAATIAPDRGVFLAQSWRMHPEICRFISTHAYDGRLEPAPGCERQSVFSPGLSGAGLRFVSVEHAHNGQQSIEEAAAIAAHVRQLLTNGAVTERDGRTRPLSPADILVVAPYNMQVRCLQQALPAGVDVGTVDRFQGREAPVVFFSMTTSSGEDVPRGLEFLFNRNRLTVAISRAKCLSVIVASPRLLEAPCRTVEQLQLVNALCDFAECAADAPAYR